MGVDQHAYLLIGVEAHDARDKKGRSLVDRFEAGEFRRRNDERNGGMDVVGAGDWLGGDPHELYVGFKVASVLDRSSGMFDTEGPVSRQDVERTFVRAKEALHRLGVRRRPRLYLLTMAC